MQSESGFISQNDIIQRQSEKIKNLEAIIVEYQSIIEKIKASIPETIELILSNNQAQDTYSDVDKHQISLTDTALSKRKRQSRSDYLCGNN